jgi:hypothetical protein
VADRLTFFFLLVQTAAIKKKAFELDKNKRLLENTKSYQVRCGSEKAWRIGLVS